MQPSRGETPHTVQRPQKEKSRAMAMISRLSVLRLLFINSFSRRPKRQPTSSIRMFFPRGTSTPEIWKPPLESMAVAREIATEYSTRPTTSSRATTCRRVSTKSPLAPVWRMVIIVEAGAVAVASAPSTTEKGKDRPSTRKQARKTRIAAPTDSSTVMVITLAPFFFRAERRKNSPVLKAMKARAISGRKPMPSTTRGGIRFRQKGPIRIPPTIYAVTFGRRSFLVTRVIRKPTASIRAMAIIVTATEESSLFTQFIQNGTGILLFGRIPNIIYMVSVKALYTFFWFFTTDRPHKSDFTVAISCRG